MIGDIVYKSLNTQGKLPCDGSLHASADYPELAVKCADVVRNELDFNIDPVVPITPGIGQQAAAEFSPDGKYLVVGGDVTPCMRIYNTDDWSLVSGTPSVSRVKNFAFSKTGRYLAIATHTAPFLYVMDMLDMSLKTITGIPTSGPQGEDVLFIDDRTLLLVCIAELYIIDTDTWEGSTKIEQPIANTYRADLSHDGKRFVVSGGRLADAAKFFIYDAQTLELVHSVDLSLNIYGVYFKNCYYSRDSRYIFLVGTNYFVAIDTSDYSVASSKSITDIIDCYPLHDNKHVVITTADYKVILHRISDWQDVQTLTFPNTQAYGFATSYPKDDRYYVGASRITDELGIHQWKEPAPSGFFYVPAIEDQKSDNMNHYPVLIEAEEV